jgi:hypothetical protein
MNANASAGCSGFTVHIIKSLVEDNICCDGICALITDLMNGFTNLNFVVDEEIRYFFTDSLLTVLEKPGGGYRPIAMTEMFLKLAARIASASLGPGNVVFPNRNQLAIRTPGGSQTAIHRIQSTFEAFADKEDDDTRIYGISFDFKNAFNARDRSAMAEKLFGKDAYSV